MRYGVLRGTGGALAVLAMLATGGCALFGSNKGEVCADTKLAVAQYVSQVKAAPANDPAAWKAATDRLAARLDALSRTSDDGEVRDALRRQAAALRAAAPTVAAGDIAALNKSLTDLPTQLGGACA